MESIRELNEIEQDKVVGGAAGYSTDIIFFYTVTLRRAFEDFELIRLELPDAYAELNRSVRRLGYTGIEPLHQEIDIAFDTGDYYTFRNDVRDVLVEALRLATREYSVFSAFYELLERHSQIL